MKDHITPLLLGIERLKQEARSVNRTANKNMENMFGTDKAAPPSLIDKDLLNLSKIANISFKLMKDLDVAEENFLNVCKIGE